jgi:hypothetical protein
LAVNHRRALDCDALPTCSHVTRLSKGR